MKLHIPHTLLAVAAASTLSLGVAPVASAHVEAPPTPAQLASAPTAALPPAIAAHQHAASIAPLTDSKAPRSLLAQQPAARVNTPSGLGWVALGGAALLALLAGFAIVLANRGMGRPARG